MIAVERQSLIPRGAYGVELLQNDPRRRALGALRIFSIPEKSEREIMWSYYENGDKNPGTIRKITDKAIALTRRKVEGIGLSLRDYIEALYAFARNDLDTLTRLSQNADTIIDDRKKAAQTTLDLQITESNEDTLDFESIINDAFLKEENGAFTEKEKPANPQLFIIAGPTGAGKSSVRKSYEQQYGDIVVADPDKIRHLIMQGYDSTNNAHVQATHDLSYKIADMIAAKAIAEGYNFAFETTLRTPQGHTEGSFGVVPAIIASRRAKHEIHATYVFADLPDCFRRAVLRDENRAVPLSTILSTPVGLHNFSDIVKMFDLDPVIVDNTAHGEDSHTIEKGLGALETRKDYYDKFIPKVLV
jgi:hypothetical protein